jgi:hypothetical protein
MTLNDVATASAVEPVDGLEAAQRSFEYMYEQGWTDGLPVIPATRERVDEFLATTTRPADEVIGRLDHLKREVTVELAAINAVMAGCKPEYFPVVLAAWERSWRSAPPSAAAGRARAAPPRLS